MDKKYYAHSLDGKAPSEWQSPEEFLKNVAEMVSSFARAFGVEDWGDLAWFNLRWFIMKVEDPLSLFTRPDSFTLLTRKTKLESV